ncbi:tetratricopeptide repeat protein [Acetobacter sacchari]|uniref:tetratricopeptide repeat protein n=1 Tax=Acetobacter sacchari TaxID=2661687 RepID=UPI00311CDF88
MIRITSTRHVALLKEPYGGFSRSEARTLAGRALLPALLLTMWCGYAAAQTPAPTPHASGHTDAPAPPGKPATPSAKASDRRDALVKALAQAHDESEATAIAAQLEEMRSHGLAPATMLLLRRANRELSQEKPGDAIEDLGAALALQGDAEILWRLRAQARLATGDTDGAIGDLGVALQHDPDDVGAWQLLAATEEQRGDGQAALKAWRRALELDPKMPGGAAREDKLKLKAFGRPT